MTPEQTETLAAAGESETLEFKSTTGIRLEVASTVSCDLPSILVAHSSPNALQDGFWALGGQFCAHIPC